MKKTLVLLAILCSMICSAQINIPIGPSAGHGVTTGNSYVGMYRNEGGVLRSEGSSFSPIYDTVKCIVIYLDGLDVKADSCFKILEATRTKAVKHFPPMGNNGTVLAVIIADTYEPDWQIFKIIRKNNKPVAIKDVIQYK